jgi:WD40 repeat protein
VSALLSLRLTQLQAGAAISDWEPPPAVPQPRRTPGKGARNARRLSAAGVALIIVLSAGWFTRGLWPAALTPANGDTSPSLAPPPSWQPRRPLSAEELADLPDPLDNWRREEIPPSLLPPVGLPKDAPQLHLVGVLGEGRFRLPRPDPTHWPAQTRDGRLLALPCGNLVAVYDTQTGLLVRTLEGHKVGCYEGNFSADGQRFACGAVSGGIRIWNVAGGNVVTSIPGKGEPLWTTLFAADDSKIVGAGPEGVVKVWDATSGREVTTLCRCFGGIAHLAFNPARTRLAVAGLDMTLKIWDWERGELVKTSVAHKEPLQRVRWSADGKLLVSGSSARAIIWDAATLEPLQTLATPADGIAAFSPDGEALVTAPHQVNANRPAQFATWKVKTGTALGVQKVASGLGHCVGDLSVDGGTVYWMPCDNRDGYLGTFDAITGQVRFPNHGHSKLIFGVAFDHDGSRLATGGSDGLVCIWNLKRRQAGALVAPERTLYGHTNHVWCVVFSPDGRLLASGSDDGTIRLWNVAGGAQSPATRGEGEGRAATTSRGPSSPLVPPPQPSVLTGQAYHPADVAFSPDGETLAAGGAEGAVNFWTVATGQPKEPMRWHVGEVRAVAVSPDGQWLASGGEDNTVQLINLTNGRRVHIFRGETACIHLAFSPDGKTLAATSHAPGAMVRLWDIGTKKERAFTGHSHHILGLAFHPGGGSLATASLDYTLRLWDTTPGKDFSRTFNLSHFGGPIGVAFSPSGRHLAVCMANATVAIFENPATLEP